MKPNVGVGVLERLQQRVDRRRVALIAERKRRLDAEIGIVVLDQRDERCGHVDVDDRQEFQRTAQHSEVPMLLPQRVDEPVDERGIRGGRQAAHADPPDSPVLVSERGPQAVGRKRLGARFDGAGGLPPHVEVGALERQRQIALGVEARRHVLDRHHHPDHPLVLAQRPEGHALLHLRESRRRQPRRTLQQVVVKGGCQDVHGSGRDHALRSGRAGHGRRDRGSAR